MSNPFMPVKEPSMSMEAALPPGAAGILSENQEIEVKDVRAGRANRTLQADGEVEKAGWWKFWGRTSRRQMEMAEMKQRHEELVEMMRTMCDTMERTKDRTIEVKAEKILPPIPVETLDAINVSQREVTGAISQLSGHLELVGANQGRFVDSMERVDRTMTSVKTVNERSVTALGRMSDAAGAVCEHVDQSGDRFEKLYGQMQEAERGFVEAFSDLQKKSMWVMAGLGVSVVVALAALALVILTVV